MAIIKIKNLLLRTYIGFNPEEIVNKQDVIINMTIKIDVSRALKNDDITNSYDYKSITKKVILLVQERRFKMLEYLTKQVLDLVMEDERVKFAQVEIDKPHALRFSESVSVVMEDSR